MRSSREEEHDQDGEGRGQPEPPPPEHGIAVRGDAGDAHEHRDLREGSELLDRMERRVQLLGQHHRGGGQTQREDQSSEQESGPVRRGRPVGDDGGVQDLELLALLTLLHVFGQLRFLVALEERLIVILGSLIVPRQLLELLLAQRRVVRARLVPRGRGLQAVLVLP